MLVGLLILMSLFQRSTKRSLKKSRPRILLKGLSHIDLELLDTKLELIATKDDISEVSQELYAVRQDFKNELREVREELKTDILNIREDIQRLEAKIEAIKPVMGEQVENNKYEPLRWIFPLMLGQVGFLIFLILNA